MSAEGKKKRGQAGITNAQNSPFRLNGRDPPPRGEPAHRIRNMVAGSAPSSGSKTLFGFLGGVLAAKLGFPYPPRNRYEVMLAHAARRVTHPLLTEPEEDDAPEIKEAA